LTTCHNTLNLSKSYAPTEAKMSGDSNVDFI
jgi:hypothetical protein